MRTIPQSVAETPGAGSQRASAVFRDAFGQVRDFANDHDASHWPFVLSAPHLSDFTFTPTNGGALTAGSTVYFSLAFKTPNGWTKASAEKAVVLNGEQNAVQIQAPAALLGVTQAVGIFMAANGAGAGTQKRLVAVANLSAAGPTTYTVLDYPAADAEVAPAVNASSGQDPLLTLMHMPFTTTIQENTPSTGWCTVTRTYDTPFGPVVETGVYFSGALLTTGGHSIKLNGVTVARYGYTYNAAGDCTARTQLEV